MQEIKPDFKLHALNTANQNNKRTYNSRDVKQIRPLHEPSLNPSTPKEPIRPIQEQSKNLATFTGLNILDPSRTLLIHLEPF